MGERPWDPQNMRGKVPFDPHIILYENECAEMEGKMKKENSGAKNRRKAGRRSVWLAAVMAALLLTGCGASGKSASSSGQIYEMAAADNVYGYDGYESAESRDTGTDWQTEEQTRLENTDRKLIKTANLSVETKEFESLMSALEKRVQELGGYIESSEIYNGSTYSGYRSSRDASLTVRIPQVHLEEFLTDVSNLSNVTHRSESVEDVTLSYVDLESHKKALLTEQDRLLELLEKAESMEDILTIEERLTSIRYQLQSMESQLRTMDNQVDYSTVYLNINEVQELTPVEEKTVGERITEGFMDSLRDVGNGILECFIWVITNLPHLIVWAVLVGILVLLILMMDKHSRKKRARKAAAAEAALKNSGAQAAFNEEQKKTEEEQK